MKKSLRTLLIAFLVGLVLAVGLNMITVRSEIAGPDGVMYFKGFPLASGSYLDDLTTDNRFVFLSYQAAFGNALIAFFTVFGVLGNISFFREIGKK